MPDLLNSYTVSEAELQAWLADGSLTDKQAELIRSRASAAPMTQVAAAHAGSPHDLNAVSIAYYFGSIFILFACFVFIAWQWEQMEPGTRLAVTLASVVTLVLLGGLFKWRGYPSQGGLLAFVGAAAVPAVVWTLLELAHKQPNDIWELFSGDRPYVYDPHLSSLIILAAACLAICALLQVVFRFQLFGLLLALWGWLLGNAILSVLLQNRVLDVRSDHILLRMVVGLILLGIGYRIQRKAHPKSYALHFSFWFYLIGHLVILILFYYVLGEDIQNYPEPYRIAYLALFVAWVALSVWIQRRVFLFFGALGIFSYLFYLAGQVFEGTLGFILTIASTGLLIVLLTVLYQRYLRLWLEKIIRPPAPHSQTTEDSPG